MEPHSRPGPTQNGTLRLLRTAIAGLTSDRVTQTDSDLALWHSQNIKKTAYRLIRFLNPFLVRGGRWTLSFVGMVELTALCGIGSALWLWRKRNGKGKVLDVPFAIDTATDDAEAADPGLLNKFSKTKSYRVPSTGFTYPALRIFYRAHQDEDKLPKEPCPIPLLVFIHGLGGSIAQFNPILLSLSGRASCLAIDLPGCGLSSFEPKDWAAYTSEALVHLLATVIVAHCAVAQGQTVILLGHSMGCSLAAQLASSTSPQASLLSQHVSGLIAICPQADPPTVKQIRALRYISSAPAAFFDLFRRWDRRGGINSKSVLRMAGADTDEETKRLQLRFNKQSRGPVWQRMAWGMCPSGSSQGGLPGREVWSGLDIPVFIAAGASDTVTPPSNVSRIVEFLGRDVNAIQPPSEKASLPIAAAPPPIPEAIFLDAPPHEHQNSSVNSNDIPSSEDDNKTIESTSVSTVDGSLVTTDGNMTDGSITTADGPLISATTTPSSNSPSPHPRRLVVKTVIMPKPAAHSLLFAPSTSRILASLIGDFLTDHIDPRLRPSWQLNYLSTEGKWDVKNLAKWAAVRPVSEPIAGVFRAMKTLREVDEEHTPKVLVKKYKGQITAVIDISHDNPVYDPKGLEEGGIPYHKYPTVSKQPPEITEVQGFIALVDKVRAEGRPGLVGVHCHYGFNRTGFFLVSYMVEREGYKVQDAIDEFKEKRFPGIRHQHFIDELHMRYFQGLKRAPTL